MFKAIQNRVLYLIKEKHKTILVAIDECQYLDTKILRDFKMLMNKNYVSMDCFALIMVGLPHMNGILKKPVHEALKQRIVVHYNYCGLSVVPNPSLTRLPSTLLQATAREHLVSSTDRKSVV